MNKVTGDTTASDRLKHTVRLHPVDSGGRACLRTPDPTMRDFRILIAACAILTAGAFHGQPARAQSAAPREIVHALSARLVLTGDPTWRSRWQAAPSQLPHFVETDEVSLGQRLEILTLITAPQPDALGLANVVCDLTVRRPDGSISAQQRGVSCLRRKVSGDARATYLSTATLKYSSDATDQKGRWTVTVRVQDRNAHTERQVEAGFTNI